jgi:tetratricopeptide (TPR) repeat protein
MERILPRDPEVLRKYAEFLGERSLSLSARQEALTEAEALQFAEVEETYRLAVTEFEYFRFEEAEKLFRKSLNQLHGIRFYQSLYDNGDIDVAEYRVIFRDVHKYLSLCRIEQGAGLEEVENGLFVYLDREDSVAAVAELEERLVEKELIGEEITAELRDLSQLSFHLRLYMAQNQYRDIMRLGRTFESSFVVVPQEQQDQYVEVMRLVGTAFLRADFIYEAGEYLDKALEMDPDNLQTLVRKRDYHVRLNEQEEAAAVQGRIDAVTVPKDMEIRRGQLRKGRLWSREWIFDGSGIEMRLDISGENFDAIPPLVTVVFNGRVVWEEYLQDGGIRFAVETKTGTNVIGVEAVNREAELADVTWGAEE